MDRSAFVQALLDCGAVQFGKFTLASGKESDWYCDKMRFLTIPALLEHVAQEMAPFAKGHDRIAGVELGAVPIAAAVSLKTRLPYVIVRKAPKEYGTRKAFEGELAKGDRVLFVEDVVTTAGTLRKSIEALRLAGAVVEQAVAVVDREEGGLENLKAAGVRLAPILTAREILKHRRQP